MSFSDMTKEQKQLVVLIVMGVVTGVSVLSNNIIGPAREEAAEARATIKSLKGKVINGDIILQRDVRNIEEIKELSQEVLALHNEHLPPEQSTYIWTVEKISNIAEELDLVILVREHPSARYRGVTREEETEGIIDTVSMWIPYAVDVNVNTSFAKMQSFLNLMEKELPYVSVGRVRVNANSIVPEEHEISFILEWPTFRFFEDLDWIRTNNTNAKK